MPTRMGGFDQIVRKRSSAGTSEGSPIDTLAAPATWALCRARSSTRALTSTPHTVASGECRAIVIAIGPHPQPTSSSAPSCAGGGTDPSSTRVPRSSPSGLKTPAAVVSESVRPARVTEICRGRTGLSGVAEK